MSVANESITSGSPLRLRPGPPSCNESGHHSYKLHWVYIMACRVSHTRVKSGKFGHEVNTHLQTMEILMTRLLMSRLIRIFMCLIS